MESYIPAELELQRRPPRNIQNRGGKFGAIRPYLIFLVPHVWIAIAAPFVLATYIYNFYSAEAFKGTVVAHDTHTNSKGNTVHNLEEEFQVNEKPFRVHYSVDQSRYDSVKDGDTVTVYALRSSPSTYNRADNTSLWQELAFGTLWVIAWCGGTFAVVYFVLAQPLRSKKLVKSGTPVQGTLDELKTSKNRNGTSYYAIYSFPYRQLDRKTGRTELASIKGKMKVSQKNYAAAESTVGKNVTVLVDESKPSCNIIYQYCDHQAMT